MSKSVILTGLRANNDLHIGNYLGALLPIVDLAKQKGGEYQVNLFIPDLHSFTTPIDHAKLQEGIMQNLRVFAAAGLPLDNPDVHIYRQSYVPAHSELTWILDCFTGFGEMRQMTQFKEKSFSQLLNGKRVMRILSPVASGEGSQALEEVQVRTILSIFEKLQEIGEPFNELDNGTLENLRHGKYVLENTQAHSLIRAFQDREKYIEKVPVTVGLFNYPVLMAADILLYGAEYVPVGDDQSQHIEFTRDIAERLNSRFGDLFVLPKSVKEQHEFFNKDQGLRIKDLADPSKKMSKSDDTGKGVIFMTDSPDEVRKKIMSATTDSVGKVAHDYEKQAGVANLLDILQLFGGNPDEFIGHDQYGPLKTAVAEAVAGFLTKFQAELAKVDDQAILAKLAASEEQMNNQANATLLKVQKAVGLRA